MTQEFKNIEEIKEEYAKSHAFDNWSSMYSYLGVLQKQDACDEITQRYAQQYIDEIENLQSIDSLRRAVVEKRDETIKDLQQSNKELVEMLERIVDAQFNPNKSLASLNMAIADAKELIAKHTAHDKGKEES